MRKQLALLLLLLFLPFPSAAETVVTSFYPIWLLTLNLTKNIEHISVHNLAAPDTGCLHDYQLQTGDMKALSDADLFLVNGAGMESYLATVFSSFPDLPVAEAAANIELLYDADSLEIGESEDEGMPNAHLWLSALNASHMAENLAEALIKRFPEDATVLQANLEDLRCRLESLHEELKAGLSPLPHKGIITFHEAFPYFAQAYGLDVLAVVNREPGETLTPSQLGQLVDVIQSLGVPPLFVEPQYEDLSARTLAAETGAEVYVLDPVVTGPDKNVPLDYYETVMRKNMATLQDALSRP